MIYVESINSILSAIGPLLAALVAGVVAKKTADTKINKQKDLTKLTGYIIVTKVRLYHLEEEAEKINMNNFSTKSTFDTANRLINQTLDAITNDDYSKSYETHKEKILNADAMLTIAAEDIATLKKGQQRLQQQQQLQQQNPQPPQPETPQ